MAEALCDLLRLSGGGSGGGPRHDSTILTYLASLAALPADALRTSEVQRLSQASHFLFCSIQGLSKRSHKTIVESAASHGSIRQSLPIIAQRTVDLSHAVPRLGHEAEALSSAFRRAGVSDASTRRKRAMLLLHNVERLVDVMELPRLLASACKMSPVNYSSVLDLYAHARRLGSLYTSSYIISSVRGEADAAMRGMAADLIASLRSPSLKLAAALRTVGWLRRIVPDLIFDYPANDILPALFLVCRLTTLLTTLAALEPLCDLANEERLRQAKSSQAWSGGQHTERYLKRFIEIFREHCFGILSMSRSVETSFPPPLATSFNVLRPLPPTLRSLPLHLVGLLLDTLRKHLPTIRDQASRDSIITQILYCASSLGRLGADFGVLLAVIGVNEWVDLVKRHRQLAVRLESVIGDCRGCSKSSENTTPPIPADRCL